MHSASLKDEVIYILIIAIKRLTAPTTAWSNKISTVHGTRLYCAFFFGAYFLAQRFTRAGREEKPINVIKLLSVVRRDHSHRARESVVPIEVVSVCVFFLRFGAAQPSTHFHLLSVRMGLLFIRRFRRIGGGRCVSVCCPEWNLCGWSASQFPARFIIPFPSIDCFIQADLLFSETSWIG